MVGRTIWQQREVAVHALVVDDSKPVRSILTKVLGELQFQCHEAANGVEALDKLVRMPRPTLITLNRHMPEMDGFELLGRLRRSPQFRDLTVVMISTDCDEASRTAARNLGANDFVAKPFTPSDLISRLQTLGIDVDRPRSRPVTPPAAAAPTAPRANAVTNEAATPPLRLLVADDSATIRGVLSKTLNAAPGIRVTATAANGEKALGILASEPIDLVLLDIEMPVMDGLATLRQIRQRYPRLPVIMFSSLTERGAKATLEALINGANDYVAKPTGVGADTIVTRIEAELIPKIRAIRRPTSRPTTTSASAPASRLAAPEQHGQTPRSRKIAAIVVAVSTGGPSALAEVLPRFVGPASPPILIVQHMPKEFTAHLAERLTKLCGHPVTEAVDGQPLTTGAVVLAPGGVHIELVESQHQPRIRFNQGPPENSCRPSADVLFRSAARVFGTETLAVVLTGMGSDGLAGCRDISAAGGTVIAQDEPTSIVWGMPGQVVRAGLADTVLPLDGIGPDIAMRLRRQRQ
jgi:two-component system chemotaxis response regulator CheB